MPEATGEEALIGEATIYHWELVSGGGKSKRCSRRIAFLFRFLSVGPWVANSINYDVAFMLHAAGAMRIFR